MKIRPSFHPSIPALPFCKGEFEALRPSSGVLEEAENVAQASAEEQRRRLDNKQRLRELRIKRLRAKVSTHNSYHSSVL